MKFYTFGTRAPVQQLCGFHVTLGLCDSASRHGVSHLNAQPLAFLDNEVALDSAVALGTVLQQ